MAKIDRRFSVAPMMDLTDRHARYFLRLISKHALLYTEMVTTSAILHGDLERLIGFNPEEHPLALQLGGSDEKDLATCAKIAEQRGYDEVNLNCGCPSDRVQKGAFGACLMTEPTKVADCVKTMIDACSIDVTVKCRIGVDDHDSYEDLHRFTTALVDAGCKTLIVHARKAWLSGLSPRENREIPPLDYPRVYRLKQDFPELEVILNGGLTNLDQADQAMKNIDGVMLGRAAYYTPWILAEVDNRIFGTSTPEVSRESVMLIYCNYIEENLPKGVPLSAMTRHTLGLYHGVSGARKFRRVISENAHLKGSGVEVVYEALSHYIHQKTDVSNHRIQH